MYTKLGLRARERGEHARERERERERDGSEGEREGAGPGRTEQEREGSTWQVMCGIGPEPRSCDEVLPATSGEEGEKEPGPTPREERRKKREKEGERKREREREDPKPPQTDHSTETPANQKPCGSLSTNEQKQCTLDNRNNSTKMLQDKIRVHSPKPSEHKP